MKKGEAPVVIVGGGIGGLTLALSLHQAGIPCRVFESAPEIRPLGVGINLLPHGMRELTELGLQERLAPLAVETSELCFYHRFGQFIYQWPQLSIHRADLHEVLLQSFLERGGHEAFLTGKKCISFEEKENHVEVKFENGETVEGSCLIGADGIHSIVRRALFPQEGPPA